MPTSSFRLWFPQNKNRGGKTDFQRPLSEEQRKRGNVWASEACTSVIEDDAAGHAAGHADSCSTSLNRTLGHLFNLGCFLWLSFRFEVSAEFSRMWVACTRNMYVASCCITSHTLNLRPAVCAELQLGCRA